MELVKSVKIGSIKGVLGRDGRVHISTAPAWDKPHIGFSLTQTEAWKMGLNLLKLLDEKA